MLRPATLKLHEEILLLTLQSRARERRPPRRGDEAGDRRRKHGHDDRGDHARDHLDRVSLSRGYQRLAARQAAIPSMTLCTRLKPARRSRLASWLER